MLVRSSHIIIIISTPNAAVSLDQLWVCFTKDLQILCCCTHSFEKKSIYFSFRSRPFQHLISLVGMDITRLGNFSFHLILHLVKANRFGLCLKHQFQS